MNRTSCNAYGNRTQTCPGRPNYCTPPQNRPVPPKYSLDLRNMNQEQLKEKLQKLQKKGTDDKKLSVFKGRLKNDEKADK